MLPSLAQPPLVPVPHRLTAIPRHPLLQWCWKAGMPDPCCHPAPKPCTVMEMIFADSRCQVVPFCSFSRHNSGQSTGADGVQGNKNGNNLGQKKIYLQFC